MVYGYGDFDVPVGITPPGDATTPEVSLATPAALSVATPAEPRTPSPP
jgi:hypothetical protein